MRRGEKGLENVAVIFSASLSIATGNNNEIEWFFRIYFIQKLNITSTRTKRSRSKRSGGDCIIIRMEHRAEGGRVLPPRSGILISFVRGSTDGFFHLFSCSPPSTAHATFHFDKLICFQFYPQRWLLELPTNNG